MRANLEEKKALWPWIGICALCLLAGLLWKEKTERQPVWAAGAFSSGARAFSGEVIAARSDGTMEYWPALGVMKAHMGMDLRMEGTACAAEEGYVTEVEQDLLWGMSVHVQTDKGEWIFRSLDTALVGEGTAVQAAQPIGVAGTAPAEEELGSHVHVEYWEGENCLSPESIPGAMEKICR